MKIQSILLAVALLFLTACSSIKYEGPAGTLLARKDVKILLVTFDNATDSESAPIALTAMTASTLSSSKVNYGTTDSNLPPLKNKETGERSTWFDIAREGGYTHLLRGTVHEYRYKTDLDGDPAVGVSMRLINVADSTTVWHASSSATGYAYASLSSASMQAVTQLIGNLFKDRVR